MPQRRPGIFGKQRPIPDYIAAMEPGKEKQRAVNNWNRGRRLEPLPEVALALVDTGSKGSEDWIRAAIQDFVDMSELAPSKMREALAEKYGQTTERIKGVRNMPAVRAAVRQGIVSRISERLTEFNDAVAEAAIREAKEGKPPKWALLYAEIAQVTGPLARAIDPPADKQEFGEPTTSIDARGGTVIAVSSSDALRELGRAASVVRMPDPAEKKTPIPA